jgi:Predicted Rossmann fold nucleotide-binding protein
MLSGNLVHGLEKVEILWYMAGSKSGLMGQIAESVLNAGGKVTGVEPQFFIDSELQYDEITELIVTKDMAERKAK